MKLEQQVTSLEISKRLKELGVNQESLFYHAKTGYTGQYSFLGTKGEMSLFASKELHDEAGANSTYDLVSAFTVAELGEMMHPHAYSIKGKSEKVEDKWICRYWGENTQDAILREHKTTIGHIERADTEADARGKMLVYLIENNLLPVKE